MLWSVTWGQQYISAPIQSLDRILPGRTTRRDLLGEMADRLHAKGIRLIFSAELLRKVRERLKEQIKE